MSTNGSQKRRTGKNPKEPDGKRFKFPESNTGGNPVSSKKIEKPQEKDEKTNENYVTKADLKQLLEKYVTKDDHEALREDHEALKGRLDNLTKVFAPASRYALFEESIYVFIEKSLPTTFHHGQKDTVQHGLTALCCAVVSFLLSKENITAFKLPIPPGFSTRRKNKLEFENRKGALLMALKGLVFYIASIEGENTLNEWPYADMRNKLVHDGAFLEALYSPPDKKDDESWTYESSQQKVMKARKALKANAKACSSPYDSVEDAVDAVFKALKEKSVSFREEARGKLVESLQKVVGLPELCHCVDARKSNTF